MKNIAANISAHVANAISSVLGLFVPAWFLRNGRKKADDSQLEGASSSCERWGIWCGALVIVAVAAEAYIAIRHPEYDSVLFRWGSAATDVLIAVGIVGEVALGMWDGRIQTELRERSNVRLAEAMKVAAEAGERAANAELELERIKQPRLIKWWDFEKRKQLLSHKGTVFGLFADNDHEALRLAQSVSRLLLISEWQQSPVVGFVDVNNGIVLLPDAVGIEIGVHRQPDIEKAEAAAAALCQYFADNGIEAGVTAGEAAAAGIAIIIGRKK